MAAYYAAILFLFIYASYFGVAVRAALVTYVYVRSLRTVLLRLELLASMKRNGLKFLAIQA
ncbi:MAG: hypothetical protein ACI4VK_03500 [Candidatus Coproplasma sp.]